MTSAAVFRHPVLLNRFARCLSTVRLLIKSLSAISWLFRFMLPAITHIIENIHQQLLGKVILTGGDSPDCRNHFFYTGIFENEPLYSDIDHFIVILFIPVHRQHDHLQIRPDPQGLFRSFYPVHLGHFYIHQHQRRGFQ